MSGNRSSATDAEPTSPKRIVPAESLRTFGAASTSTPTRNVAISARVIASPGLKAPPAGITPVVASRLIASWASAQVSSMSSKRAPVASPQVHAGGLSSPSDEHRHLRSGHILIGGVGGAVTGALRDAVVGDAIDRSAEDMAL